MNRGRNGNQKYKFSSIRVLAAALISKKKTIYIPGSTGINKGIWAHFVFSVWWIKVTFIFSAHIKYLLSYCIVRNIQQITVSIFLNVHNYCGLSDA